MALDHVPAAGLGDEERACEVDVEETTEHLRVVIFGFDVGAGARGVSKTFRDFPKQGFRGKGRRT